MRLRVVRGRSDVQELYKPGQVFTAICDSETVDLLLTHYIARAV